MMVAIIVIGRSGTAIAAEMASMKLSGEVDSLWASGMNPVQYLLIPRLLGGIVSIFTLIVFFGAVALLGGFFLAWLWLPLSWRAFLDSLGKVIGSRELAITLVKSMLFGTFIPLICAYCGLRVQASPTEIPQAVTKAAVYSLVVVLVGGRRGFGDALWLGRSCNWRVSPCTRWRVTRCWKTPPGNWHGGPSSG